MLPKKFRLTVREFNQNHGKSRQFVSSVLSLTIKATDNPQPRFVVIVSKKLEKRSVFRHQTKRIIVEAIRKYLKNITFPVDALVKMKKIVGKKDSFLVENEIFDLFKKASLL